MSRHIPGLGRALGILCFALMMTTSTKAQEDQERAYKGPMGGKVSTLIKRTKTAEVSGRKHNFKRLVGDDEQHDAMMRKFSEPMNEEERKALHAKKLARYGSARTNRQVALTDFGESISTKRKRPAAKSAAEPVEDSSNTAVIIIFAILAGSMYVIKRNSS